MSSTANSVIISSALESVSKAIEFKCNSTGENQLTISDFVADVGNLNPNEDDFEFQCAQISFYKASYILLLTAGLELENGDKLLILLREVISALNDLFKKNKKLFKEMISDPLANNCFLYLYFIDLINEAHVFTENDYKEMVISLLASQTPKMQSLLLFLLPIQSKDNEINNVFLDFSSIEKIKSESSRSSALKKKLNHFHLTMDDYPSYYSLYLKSILTSNTLRLIENNVKNSLSVQLLSQLCITTFNVLPDNDSPYDRTYLSLYGEFRNTLAKQLFSHILYRNENNFYYKLSHDISMRHLQQLHYLNGETPLEGMLGGDDVLFLLSSIKVLLEEIETKGFVSLSAISEKEFYTIYGLIFTTPKFYNETLLLELSKLAEPLLQALLKFNQYELLLTVIGGLLEASESPFPIALSFERKDYESIYYFLKRLRDNEALECLENQPPSDEIIITDGDSVVLTVINHFKNTLFQLSGKALLSDNVSLILNTLKKFDLVFKEGGSDEIIKFKNELSELKKFLFVFSKLKKLKDDFTLCDLGSVLRINLPLLEELFKNQSLSGIDFFRKEIVKALKKSVERYQLTHKKLLQLDRLKLINLLRFVMPVLKLMQLSQKDDQALQHYYTDLLHQSNEGVSPPVLEKKAEQSVSELAKADDIKDGFDIKISINQVTKIKRKSKKKKKPKNKVKSKINIEPLVSPSASEVPLSGNESDLSDQESGLSDEEESEVKVLKETFVEPAIAFKQDVSLEDTEGFQQVSYRKKEMKKTSKLLVSSFHKDTFFEPKKGFETPLVTAEESQEVTEKKERKTISFSALSSQDFPSLPTKSIDSDKQLRLKTKKESGGGAAAEESLLEPEITTANLGLNSQQFYSTIPVVYQSKLPAALISLNLKIQTFFGVSLILTGKAVFSLYTGKGKINDYDGLICNVELITLQEQLKVWGIYSEIIGTAHPILTFHLGDDLTPFEISTVSFSNEGEKQQSLYDDAFKRDLLNTALHLPLDKGNKPYFEISDPLNVLYLIDQNILEINGFFDEHLKKTSGLNIFTDDPIRFLRVIKELIEQSQVKPKIGTVLGAYLTFIGSVPFQYNLWNNFLNDGVKMRSNRGQFQTKLTCLFKRYTLDELFTIFSNFNILEGLSGLDKSTANHCYELSKNASLGKEEHSHIIFYLTVSLMILTVYQHLEPSVILKNNFFHSIYLNKPYRLEFEALKNHYFYQLPIDENQTPFALLITDDFLTSMPLNNF